MKYVRQCAWCSKSLDAQFATLNEEEPGIVTHGICKECGEALLAEAEKEIMSRIRVAIVDDHPAFREALRGILDMDAEIDVVAEAENGLTAIGVVQAKQPQVILMDVNMPVMDGFAATKFISSKHPGSKVIILSMHSDAGSRFKAYESGARYFLSKASDPDSILTTIRDCSSQT